MIINSLKVGYHAWRNKTEVVVFVLGEPNTLRVYSTATKQDIVVAENIGRSLHHIPGSDAICFVDKHDAKVWTIKKLNADGTVETIAETLPEKEDIAWVPDGRILTSDGHNIFILDPKQKKDWQAVAMPTTISFKGITRIAINADGTLLALVETEE